MEENVPCGSAGAVSAGAGAGPDAVAGAVVVIMGIDPLGCCAAAMVVDGE